MRLAILILLAAAAFAQTPTPTLAATVTFSTPTQACVVEFLSGKAWKVVCQSAATGEWTEQSARSKGATGTGVFNDEWLCMADDDTGTAGQQLFTCAVSGKEVIRGLTPAVTKKRRWWAFWG